MERDVIKDSADLEVYLFKTPEIYYHKKLVAMPYKKAEALLYYIIIEKHTTREQAATLVWENCEDSTAKKNLRHALYTIKKAFPIDIVISPDRQSLCLNPSLKIYCDYDDFIQNCKIGLYHGEFMSGFFVKNSYSYDEWQLFYRNKVRTFYLHILGEKLKEPEALSVSQAESFFEKYISQDPLEESAYYYMMKIYGENGLYYKGIRIYHQLKTLLYQELRVLPGKEISCLYEEFLEKDEERLREIKNVGHEKEKRQLRNLYRKFSGGNYENCLLTGESGVGKTYLLEQFLRQISEDSRIVFKVVCLENEQRINLQPWNVIMLQMVKAVKSRIIQTDEEYVRAAEDLFPVFLSEEGEDAFATDCTIPNSYIGIRNLFLRYILKISENNPLIIVFDNVQYMDPVSLDLLTLLIRREEKNLMLLMTGPEVWGDRMKEYFIPLVKEKYVEQIKIAPFSKPEVQNIIEYKLGKADLDPDFIDKIYKESRGNAFFLEMLLKEYSEGNLKREGTSSFRKLFQAQIDSLPKLERQVLEVISACQAWADLGTLEYILHRDSIELLEALDSLKEKEYIQEKQIEDQSHFIFNHGDMQKFVYEQLSFSKRNVLHEKLAEYTENQPAYDFAKKERLIYHYSICGNRQKALEYMIKSMAEYAGKYYELYPVFSSSCRKEDFQSFSLIRQCTKIEDELCELYQKDQNNIVYARLYILLQLTKAQYFIPQGYYEKGLDSVRKASITNEMFERDSLTKIRCMRFIIYYQLNIWKLEDTEKYLKESLYEARKEGFEQEYAITCRLYGLYYSMTGEFDKSMDFLRKSLEFFLNIPIKSRIYALNISACYNYMGEVMRKQKKLEEAVDFYQKAIKVCENNHCVCNAIIYTNMGRCRIAQGKEKEGRDAIYMAEEVYRDSFTLIGRSINKGYMSIFEAKAGNTERAAAFLKEAEESARQFGSPYSLGILHIHKAYLKEHFREDFQEILCEGEKAYREKARFYLDKIPGGYSTEAL